VPSRCPRHQVPTPNQDRVNCETLNTWLWKGTSHMYFMYAIVLHHVCSRTVQVMTPRRTSVELINWQKRAIIELTPENELTAAYCLLQNVIPETVFLQMFFGIAYSIR